MIKIFEVIGTPPKCVSLGGMRNREDLLGLDDGPMKEVVLVVTCLWTVFVGPRPD